MQPRSWRLSLKLTLSDLSKLMGGISTGYLSEVERGLKDPSGRVLKLYHQVSKKQVTLDDFPVKPLKTKR